EPIAVPISVISSVSEQAERAPVIRPGCDTSKVTCSRAGSIAVPVCTSGSDDAATNADELEYQRTGAHTRSAAGGDIGAARARTLRSHSGSVNTVARGTIPRYLA